MGYSEKLEAHQRQVFTSEDLTEILGSRQAISRAEASGEVSRIARGFYGVNVPTGTEFYAIVHKYYPEAIVCGFTALFVQGLSDYLPSHIDLAVPRESNPSRVSEFFNFHRISTSKLVGVETKIIDGYPIKVFTPERCLYEAASGGGSTESFVKAMNGYFKSGSINFDAIGEFRDVLPGYEIIVSALQSLKESKSIY